MWHERLPYLLLPTLVWKWSYAIRPWIFGRCLRHHLCIWRLVGELCRLRLTWLLLAGQAQGLAHGSSWSADDQTVLGWLNGFFLSFLSCPLVEGKGEGSDQCVAGGREDYFENEKKNAKAGGGGRGGEGMEGSLGSGSHTASKLQYNLSWLQTSSGWKTSLVSISVGCSL